MSEPTIEDYYVEDRTFPPSDAFQSEAIVTDRSLYEEAEADRLGFWARQARELVTWFEDFDTVLEWDLPFAKWFTGGKLNVSYNCLDRHVDAGLADKVAFYWEGEPGDTRTITYGDLLEEVSKFANVLKSMGVEKGDRVCIYMPMIPELPVAMLACARIGAPHSIVFGGFSADSLSDRIDDASAKVLITADGGYRRGDPFPLKDTADASVEATSTIENVVVVERTGQQVAWNETVDHWYHELMETASSDCPPEQLDSEDLLYLLYT
ncbi:MAG TPA: acetyl-coenzyme A synthetase, partial [Acidimicrobiaceae bacterium]|nr:acetyl-coenzyme A synthetase [Acidimicrobiaceae bacterium]